MEELGLRCHQTHAALTAHNAEVLYALLCLVAEESLYTFASTIWRKGIMVPTMTW